MKEETDDFIYGCKCRVCAYISIWYFSEASENKLPLLFAFANEKRVNGCEVRCRECGAPTLHDLLFYGRKSTYDKLIKKIESNRD